MRPVGARVGPEEGLARAGTAAQARGTRPAADGLAGGRIRPRLVAVHAVADRDVRQDPVGDVLVVGIGAFAALACDTASVLEKHGIEVTVVDPRWVLPVPESIVAMAADHRLVVTLEDGLVDGGVGAELIDALAAAGIGTPVMQRGIPKEFIAAATRGEILADLGLSAQELSRTITETVSQRIDDSSDSSVERATADDAG